MGSRSFYEGWDSNRPNIILFINIGKGTDARKFVLQSIGRGVRIEPLSNKRRRALFLYNNQELDGIIFNKIKDDIDPLETLFVYGTKAENLEEVINTLNQEKYEEVIGDLFDINPDLNGKSLLIPYYQKSNKLIIEEQDMVKFTIHSSDYDKTAKFYNYMDDKVILCKFDCNIKVLSEIRNAFNSKKNKYFVIDNNVIVIGNPELLLPLIFKHFANKMEEFEYFKQLKMGKEEKEEIIHFRYIRITKDKLDSIKDKIRIR
jgi:hypothetical protein